VGKRGASLRPPAKRFVLRLQLGKSTSSHSVCRVAHHTAAFRKKNSTATHNGRLSAWRYRTDHANFAFSYTLLWALLAALREPTKLHSHMRVRLALFCFFSVRPSFSSCRWVPLILFSTLCFPLALGLLALATGTLGRALIGPSDRPVSTLTKFLTRATTGSSQRNRKPAPHRCPQFFPALGCCRARRARMETASALCVCLMRVRRGCVFCNGGLFFVGVLPRSERCALFPPHRFAMLWERGFYKRGLPWLGLVQVAWNLSPEEQSSLTKSRPVSAPQQPRVLVFEDVSNEEQEDELFNPALPWLHRAPSCPPIFARQHSDEDRRAAGQDRCVCGNSSMFLFRKSFPAACLHR
jgi:hypothetical protein